MKTINTPNRKKRLSRRVFSSSTPSARKSKARRILESILILTVGIIITSIVNIIPHEYNIIVVINDTWSDFSIGSILVFQSLIKVLLALLYICLLIAGLLSILSGALRLSILVFKKRSSGRKR